VSTSCFQGWRRGYEDGNPGGGTDDPLQTTTTTTLEEDSTLRPSTSESALQIQAENKLNTVTFRRFTWLAEEEIT
jgi:hypothetical protein